MCHCQLKIWKFCVIFTTFFAQVASGHKLLSCHYFDHCQLFFLPPKSSLTLQLIWFIFTYCSLNRSTSTANFILSVHDLNSTMSKSGALDLATGVGGNLEKKAVLSAVDKYISPYLIALACSTMLLANSHFSCYGCNLNLVSIISKLVEGVNFSNLTWSTNWEVSWFSRF